MPIKSYTQIPTCIVFLKEMLGSEDEYTVILNFGKRQSITIAQPNNNFFILTLAHAIGDFTGMKLVSDSAKTVTEFKRLFISEVDSASPSRDTMEIEE